MRVVDKLGRACIDGKRAAGSHRPGLSKTIGPRSFAASIDLLKFSLKIKQKAIEIGFDLAAIAAADSPEHSPFLDEWLARGYAGEMAYLQRAGAIRKNLRIKFPWAESLVCVAFQYPAERPDHGVAKHISRYAQGDDYHDVLDQPLKALENFIGETYREDFGEVAKTWRYVDTGPVMEKLYAASSGIGWFGKNTLVLNETRGSYLLLAEIVTNLRLPPDPPAAERCGTCTRCLEACPTNAFVSPYVLDATRCISYQTIETKKPIPDQIAEHLEENLFGCDICQEVCPWNRDPIVKKQGEDQIVNAFRPRTAYLTLNLPDISAMTADQFQATFRKSPLKRPGQSKLGHVARMISDPLSAKGREEAEIPPESRESKPHSSTTRNTPSV